MCRSDGGCRGVSDSRVSGDGSGDEVVSGSLWINDGVVLMFVKRKCPGARWLHCSCDL